MDSRVFKKLRLGLFALRVRICAGSALTLLRLPRTRGGNRHAQQIRAEQIRLLYDQLSSALIATVVVGGLVVYVFWNQVLAPLASDLAGSAELDYGTADLAAAKLPSDQPAGK